MKLLERVLDFYTREMVNIGEMQLSFVRGRGTIDAIFIVIQLQEKYLTAKKPLYFAFVDIEKAFDCVPRKIPWWALRSLGVKEWAVRFIQGMYSKARCCVQVSTVRSLAWELVCIRVLSLIHCASSWCWRRCCMSSALVNHRSSSALMTWCPFWTPKRSVSPSSRRGRLAWKVKGSMSTWRRPCSWYMVMARVSSRNLASTIVLSAIVVLEKTLSCAHSVWCGSTRRAVTYKQLVEDPNYICPR